MKDIKEVHLQWLTIFFFFIKGLRLLLLKMELCKINNKQKNCINKLLEILKNEKYIHHL